jgi:hypothetical protein
MTGREKSQLRLSSSLELYILLYPIFNDISGACLLTEVQLPDCRQLFFRMYVKYDIICMHPEVASLRVGTGLDMRPLPPVNILIL